MSRYLHSQVFISLLLLCQYRLLDARGILFSSDMKLDSKTRLYNNLVVIISSNQNRNNCKQILAETQVMQKLIARKSDNRNIENRCPFVFCKHLESI